jgi:ATP-dependent Lon protease
MLNPTKSLPIIASRNFVLFPERTSPLIINRPQSIKAIERAADFDNYVLIVAQKENHTGKAISPKSLYRYGTLAKIQKIEGDPSQAIQVTVEGLRRVHLIESVDKETYEKDGFLSSKYEDSDDVLDCDEGTRDVLVQSMKSLALQILQLIPADTHSLEKIVEAIDDLQTLIPLVVENLDISLAKKQEAFETIALKARALLTLELMAGVKQALEVQSEIGKRLSKKLNKQQREAILREQLTAIRQELGESDDSDADISSYIKRINDAHLPEGAKKIALEEAKRLEQISAQSPENHVIRNYLDLILALPWNASTEDHIDLDHAREILDQDHHGLRKIKQRITQHLAVLKLNKTKRGSILLFVGPPGVGKTSLGESIAKALGRKFVRVALGGVRDDAEIRGHRKTYIGAMPGRIIQGIKRAGTNNPVFLLDEIDKLGRGFSGDPSAALLEVLDPEQNSTFTDHFLDLPFDLSSIFFIATANSLDGIPAPLLDRMEVIELSGYTTAEKLNIAKKFLLPKELNAHGLDGSKIVFTDSAVLKIIQVHTREAGVRDLQRKIQMLCRWTAEKILDTGKADITIDAPTVSDVLGPDRYRHEVAVNLMPPGVVTGLAWTPVGGDILFIEATQMPGTGKLTLTGQLGDVMKESAQIAMSLVRSHLGPFISGEPFDKRDIHIHVPSGGIPKDGPSAGIAMLTTIASLVTGVRVNSKLAMTGEVTLRGSVTPVGGIKDKVLAAHRAGVEIILLPKQNEHDYLEVPEDVRKQLTVHFVEHVNEVMALALGMRDSFAPIALIPSSAESRIMPPPTQMSSL